MGKLVLLQQYKFTSLGPMYSSAVLKQGNHDCVLLIEPYEADFLEAIRKEKPTLVGFQVFTGQQHWAIDWARKIKAELNVPVIFGGPHATHNPELIRDEQSIDYICRGEGEQATLDLINAIENSGSVTDIPNIWARVDGEVIENELRPLADVDKLPFPDRELYYRYPLFKENVVKRFITGRGCKHRCTFCHNHLDIELYKSKGEWARKRSPRNVIDEIKEVRDNYPLEILDFSPDDYFLSSKQWAKEFLTIYKAEVGLPFVLNTRPEAVSREVAQALKSAGCRSVAISIESAIDELRNGVLKKNTELEDIRNAMAHLHEAGLLTKTYNMIGIPGETIEQALETLKLNMELRPTWGRCSIISPYPNTELWNIGVAQGKLEPMAANEFSDNYTDETLFDLEDKHQFINLQRWFQVCVRFPFLYPLVRRLIRLPQNFLVDLMGRFVFGYYGSLYFGYRLSTKVKYALTFLRTGQPI